MEAGEFDDLPGAGKPIPDIDRPYDPAWWAKKLVERERLRDLAGNARRRRRVDPATDPSEESESWPSRSNQG